MPTNLDALIRYHTIDQCLQRKFKQWTISTLGEACFNAIDQTKPVKGKSTISKRTIEDDIRIMRSDILGYNAPIEIKNNIVKYTDSNYSIKNCTLNNNDIEYLARIAKVLELYNGFKLNTGINDILNKLETQVHISHFKEIENIIQFESCTITNGNQHLDFLLNVILEKQPINIIYQKFNHEEETHLLHPYFLKEFNGRWYLLGYHHSKKIIKTYALDRIITIETQNTNYIPNTLIDVSSYFNNTIGVSFPEKKPEKIRLKFHEGQLNYLLTQSFHNSQKIIEQIETYIIIEVYLVINNELIMKLLGLYGGIEVITPIHLKETIIKELHKQLNNYL